MIKCVILIGGYLIEVFILIDLVIIFVVIILVIGGVKKMVV